MKKIFGIIIIGVLLLNSMLVYAVDDIVISDPGWVDISDYIDERINNNKAAGMGKCGDGVKWSAMTVISTGETQLTISGTGDMYNYESEGAPWYEDYRTEITYVMVSEGVTYIGNYSFYDCVGLKNIELSNELTEIGYDAFKKCENLENIVIPDSVSVIGSSAFEGCLNLQSVKLPGSLTKLNAFIFTDCKSLEEITINSGVTSIDMGAFTNCTSLKTIYIPKSVTEIGKRVFYGCSNLCEIIYEGSEDDWENITIDSSNNSVLEQCDFTYLGKNAEKIIEAECPHCLEILEITEKEYNEGEYIICPTCSMSIVFNGDDIETECYICGNFINIDDLVYDDDDNLICQECFDELQNAEDLIYIECPHCGESFEDSEEIYDSDGYAICPYCDEYIDDTKEITGEIEIEFITSDWAFEEVCEAYQNNLIPDEMLEDVLYDTVTREEFAAIAVKLYENMIGEAPYAYIYDMPFADCDFESEYISYIAAAYELGITKGTSASTFSPYENISREQLATMLYRVIKLCENDKTKNFDVNNVRKFYDDSEISDYAKESVYFMAENAIIKGVDGAHFAPKDTATKEQSILISVRCVNSPLEY